MPPGTPGPHPTSANYASSFARVALANIEQEYPNKPDHVLNGPADLLPPRSLHPAFYGSYDWHSCVHMHWLLVRLLRRFPGLPEAAQIRATFDRHFTADNVGGEMTYLQSPSRQSFERTYGWGWLLKLQAELIVLAKSSAEATAWCDALQPLADVFVERYLHFLPLAQHPIRSGTHANSAFGLLFALDYAEQAQHAALRSEISAKARAWFGCDHRYPAAYEPSGDDFLSGGLMEAAMMLRVLDRYAYANWWRSFCPAPRDFRAWLTPVAVSDRSDPKLAHLDGVNLSRAWCWKMITPQLPAALRSPVGTAIDAHLSASLPFTVDGNYASTHWLASFALLALTA